MVWKLQFPRVNHGPPNVSELPRPIMPADEYARRLTESRSRMVEGRATQSVISWGKDGKRMEKGKVFWFHGSFSILNCFWTAAQFSLMQSRRLDRQAPLDGWLAPAMSCRAARTAGHQIMKDHEWSMIMKDHDVDDSLIMLKVASGCLDGRMPCLLKGSSLPCSKECGIQEHKLPTRCSTTVKAGTSWEGVPGIRWDKNSRWLWDQDCGYWF